MTMEFSDMDIICKEEVFQVHRLVVCLLSRRLRKEVLRDVEHEEPRVMIEMHNCDPYTVGRLVQYLYTGNYEVDNDLPDDFMITAHILMKQIAKRYDVIGLEQLVQQKVQDVCGDNQIDCSLHGALPIVIRGILEECPDLEPLEEVTQLIAKKLPRLLPKNSYRSLFLEHPEFAVRVLEQCAKLPGR